MGFFDNELLQRKRNALGFTGTQSGLNVRQRTLVAQALSHFKTTRGNVSVEFHHGDCIGADEQAASVARSLDFWIVSHPPLVATKRAFSVYDAERPAADYLVRNKEIVNECSSLIACPKEKREELRSGTWATVRYARKAGIPVTLLHRDGTITLLREDGSVVELQEV